MEEIFSESRPILRNIKYVDSVKYKFEYKTKKEMIKVMFNELESIGWQKEDCYIEWN